VAEPYGIEWPARLAGSWPGRMHKGWLSGSEVAALHRGRGESVMRWQGAGR
jgi:hypothetical protein